MSNQFKTTCKKKAKPTTHKKKGRSKDFYTFGKNSLSQAIGMRGGRRT